MKVETTEKVSTVQVYRMAGRGVAKVVNRCNEAKENNQLDISECQLTQIPDAMYMLLKNTLLETCDFSANLLKRLPSKFVTKFPNITELDLHGNKLSTLPDEMRDMSSLKVLNLSDNSFESLPPVVYSLCNLRNLNAENNSIADVDTPRLKSMTAMVELNIQENPLTHTTYVSLLDIRLYTVLLTPQDSTLDSVD